MEGTAAFHTRTQAPPSPSRGAPSRRRPPGRLILVAFVVAAVAFLASTVVTATRLSSVSFESERIYTEAIPSVVALTTLRERMRELLTGLNQAVDARRTELPTFDEIIAEIRKQESAVAAHPIARQASDPWLTARGGVQELIAAAERVRRLLEFGDFAGARAMLDGDVRPAAAAAATELLKLEDRSAAAGASAARDIDRTRRRATLLSFALDALSVAIAGVLAVMAARAVRRYSRLSEARQQELEQFAARVAHDVRGPLSPALFALQRVARELPAESPSRAAVDRGIASVGRVTTLVDDMLAFAKSGGRPDPSARASVLAAVRAAVEDARPSAEARSIELRIDPAAVESTVACAAGMLTSVVSNLVRNAIKYMGDAKERRVTVRVSRADHGARVEVEDTGPGLPPDADCSIFEPYVRADRTGQPGLGLGLATVKRVVEAHGGRVGVQSPRENDGRAGEGPRENNGRAGEGPRENDGRAGSSGCTFWFELPAVSGEVPASPVV